jgi:hypothetical protein
MVVYPSVDHPLILTMSLARATLMRNVASHFIMPTRKLMLQSRELIVLYMKDHRRKIVESLICPNKKSD